MSNMEDESNTIDLVESDVKSENVNIVENQGMLKRGHDALEEDSTEEVLTTKKVKRTTGRTGRKRKVVDYGEPGSDEVDEDSEFALSDDDDDVDFAPSTRTKGSPQYQPKKKKRGVGKGKASKAVARPGRRDYGVLRPEDVDDLNLSWSEVDKIICNHRKWSKQTIPDIKQHLRRLKLKLVGKKAEIIDRIIAAGDIVYEWHKSQVQLTHDGDLKFPFTSKHLNNQVFSFLCSDEWFTVRCVTIKRANGEVCLPYWRDSIDQCGLWQNLYKGKYLVDCMLRTWGTVNCYHGYYIRNFTEMKEAGFHVRKDLNFEKYMTLQHEVPGPYRDGYEIMKQNLLYGWQQLVDQIPIMATVPAHFPYQLIAMNKHHVRSLKVRHMEGQAPFALTPGL